MGNLDAYGHEDHSGKFYSEQQQQSPSPQPAIPLQSFKFSQDELRVLAQCNRDSFYQRCLPIGTGLGLAAFAAVQSGHLKANPRFGAFPKVSLAVVVGYFLGKLSYQQACAEKLMALPGSYIGQQLRERRDGKIGGTSLPGHVPSMFGAGPGDIYSDAGSGSSLNLDTDRPLFNDDSYRPDNEGSGGVPMGSPDSGPPRPSLSYDDLRRKNRGEYVETKQDPYRMDPGSASVISRPQAPSPSTHTTNKYGDIMDQ